jgi:hypothetical protein
MTIYYICCAADLTDLELSQTEEARLACEIISAAYMYEERVTDLLAIEADSENRTYAQLKGVALCSIELNAPNLHIWRTEGRKIFEYLLDPLDDDNRVWSAYGTLHAALDDYEGLCDQSSVFNGLGEGLLDAVSAYLHDNLHEERANFAKILKRVYQIQQLDVVSS